MPQITRLGALRIADPDAWKNEIEEAMTNADGRVPDAAEVLEISPRQLFRWLALPELVHVERVSNGHQRSSKRNRKPKAPPVSEKVLKASDDIPIRRKKRVS